MSSIAVQARSSDDLTAAYQEADHLLLRLHGITTPTDADFTITSEQSLISTATSVDRTLTILLGGVAGISLLVGGIGVMNIMLVSVTERIREIGLRKALGARPSVIRRQFLVEASVLGLIGGALGALLGVIGATFLPGVVGDPITISPTAMVGALVVALAIGIAFGVYPASRAAHLSPIDAGDSSPRPNRRKQRMFDMQTPIGRRAGQRWARNRAGPAPWRSSRPRRSHRSLVRRPRRPRTERCQRKRGGTVRYDHGGAEPQHRPDRGELDGDDDVLQVRDRGRELARRR